MSDDDLDAFTYDLTEFLNPMLPPEKYMGNFFDTDDKYEPLREFVLNWFEKFVTKDRNYN